MSSLRSHFRQHLQQNDPVDHQQKQSSRIPTKSSSVESKTSKAAQHVSKLSKRASRSIASDTIATRSATTVPTPVHAPPNSVQQSKRVSIGPSTAPVPPVRYNAFPAPPALRTPSLVSGSSASTFDSPRSNGLRRKPSGAIDRYAAQRRAESAGEDIDRTKLHSRNAFDDSVFGISVPRAPIYEEKQHSIECMEDAYDEEEFLYGKGVAYNVTPPVPPPSFTPSTRYTDSPFSHVPTPSSASSYSPTVLSTSGPTTRQRQPSPTRSRPPVSGKAITRDEASRLGLPPVRESSASSTSTVRVPTNKLPIMKRDVSRKPSVAVPPGKPNEVARLPSHKFSKNPRLSTARQPGQVLPELAHLNVEASSNINVQKPLPPVRPSRDGTPDLAGMETASHVVQSDLPRLYTTYHKRTPSQETPVSAPSPSFKTRFGFSPKPSSRSESPRVDSAISPPPAARTFNRGPTPDILPSDGATLRRQDSPAIAASPSKTSRFGFFSRKSKGDEAKPTEKPKRAPTKGPAAGTGHERYGRYGFRGRSGSTTSSTGFRSPSADSSSSSAPRPGLSRQSSLASKDGSDLDDFLKERLNPVILRGSGSTLSRTTSNSDKPNSHLDSLQSSSLESFARPQLLSSALQEKIHSSPQKSPFKGARQQSDSSEDEFGAGYSSLAARRSSTRLSQTESRSPTRVPPPINTNLPMQPTTIDSYDADTSAWPQSDSTLPPSEDALHGREGLWLRSPQAEPAKPARKLNFFQRALAAPRSKGKARAAGSADNSRPAVFGPAVAEHPYRPIAHYAMLDPVESVGLEEVSRMMRENETSAEESMSESSLPSKVVPYEDRHTSFLPPPRQPGSETIYSVRAKTTPPRITVNRQDSSESPELLRAQPVFSRQSAHIVNIPRSPSGVRAHTPTSAQNCPFGIINGEDMQHPIQAASSTPELNSSESPKQSRLSPIGRIPKVVSKRDRDRKLPDTSFSRPFVHTQPRPTVKPPGSVYSQIREMASPIEPGSQPVSSTSTRSDGNSVSHASGTATNVTSVSTNRTSMDIHAHNEFIVFPRKNSDQSYSTSSGNPSWLSGLYTHLPQQEDIWNEYNDFMDDVVRVNSNASSAGSSRSVPFQPVSASNEPYSSMHALSLLGPAPTADLPLPPGAAPVQTVPSVPQQVSRFLQPLSPMTPDTLSGFISGYGNRSTSTIFTPHRASLPPPPRSSIPRPIRSSLSSVRESVASSRHSRASTHSRITSLPESDSRNSQSSLTPSARFNYDAQLSDIAESKRNSSSSMASLRRGALMTSKWLSFGRVLFSPAHHEIQFIEEPRILVIDGLSSDWSYYVAHSYPSAEVCNLSLSADSINSDAAQWAAAGQQPPSNHRQFSLTSMSAAFPFPKGFFAAVVFRFPTATTEQAYHACISECKRVLRPGGYLEVAVLDLDLMNMSTKTRKAVRELKTRMQQCDRDVCLKNLSDILVRLIGRRGFDEVKRCVVGVPAAGRIPRSRDVSSISSEGSGRPLGRRDSHNNSDKNFNLAGMFQDARDNQFGPGKGSDESITKMVARVGRWWYSACYERSLLPGDRSIWNDRALLRECEQQGTSFRLLICHAQKPAQTCRRTVSV